MSCDLGNTKALHILRPRKFQEKYLQLETAPYSCMTVAYSKRSDFSSENIRVNAKPRKLKILCWLKKKLSVYYVQSTDWAK